MTKELKMNSKEFKDKILNNPEFETKDIQLLSNGEITMSLIMGLFINSDMLYEIPCTSDIKHFIFIHNPKNKYIGCMIPFDSAIIYLYDDIKLKIKVVDENE